MRVKIAPPQKRNGTFDKDLQNLSGVPTNSFELVQEAGLGIAQIGWGIGGFLADMLSTLGERGFVDGADAILSGNANTGAREGSARDFEAVKPKVRAMFDATRGDTEGFKDNFKK